MDNKRLDEAVEVAAKALFEDQCPEDRWSAPMDEDERQSWRDGARKVLLAGMKVLLGPVVGHSSFSHQMGNRHYISMSPVLIDSAIETGAPLYAPSLGEGDGR